ncbi:tetratricopeptide repeat protein [bacterium]|nr:tetratricopeptide repeat protein [bacterium]
MNHTKSFFSGIILAGTLLFCAARLFAAELVLDDEAVYRYAMHLYRNGEYYRAVSEYQRLLHYFPDSRFTGDVQLQIGRSYMAGGRTEDAITFWEKQLDEESADSNRQNRLKILYGISLLDLDLSNAFRLRRRHIEQAMTTLAEVNPLNGEGQQIQAFVRDWSSRPEPETKSPWVAGTLSAVIPGSGSFYTGRYLEGTYAFFLTSLFWLATVDAIASEDRALTGLFGFFTLAFYGGNIYTAVNSAHKYNDQLESDDLQRLRRRYGVWFIPETDRRAGRF